MEAQRKITLADLEARPGWNAPGADRVRRGTPEPAVPRGTCLSCGATGEHRYVRRVFSTGAGFHVMAACVACGCNARGAGQWVARDEVETVMGWRAEDLPEANTAAGQGVLL